MEPNQNNLQEEQQLDTEQLNIEQDSNETNDKKASRKKEVLSWVRYIGFLVLLWLFIMAFTKFVYGFCVVDGHSMDNTLADGQIGIVQKYNLKDAIKRNDIVIFWCDDFDEYLVKRCVAVAGDTISMKDGVLKVNGKIVKEDYIKEPMTWNNSFSKITLAKDEYFCMGDNRNNSSDCRDIGPVSYSDMSGILAVNLGKYGFTKKSAKYFIIVLFALVFGISFVTDLIAANKEKKKNETVNEEEKIDKE